MTSLIDIIPLDIDELSIPRFNPPSIVKPQAIELFAGVGGFRLGLQKHFDVIWSNQWEPSTKRQDASQIYENHFKSGTHVCEDIEEVVRKFKSSEIPIPGHHLLVGGFPCQDYSVARTLNQADGLVGKKGVLWWSIYRLLEALGEKRPRFILLENVDRLLKSPAIQRGRDFAVMLGSLARLGYRVEWRVVNAADYGFPQRRRRVFIVGERICESGDKVIKRLDDPREFILKKSILARALRVRASKSDGLDILSKTLDENLEEVSDSFGKGDKVSWFRNAGVIHGSEVHTVNVLPLFNGRHRTLGDILQPDNEVDDPFFIPESQLEDWRKLKGAKKELRTHRGSGAQYYYSEGAVAFPDSRDKPSRTILTGEGGSGASRFKHIVDSEDDRGDYRRLTPAEMEKLNGFSGKWTQELSDNRRAFMMGNALVIGIVKKIAKILREDIDDSVTSAAHRWVENPAFHSNWD